MPCFKTLPLSAAPSGDVPLQDAVYVSSVDKIFGVSGVYVVQFNASTGKREAQVRISSPVMGTARLVYHAATGMIYASIWNEPNQQFFSLSHPNRDVYPINPATLSVGARLQLTTTGKVASDFGGVGNGYWGPKWLGSSGNYLYVQWAASNSTFYQWLRVNPTNLADVCTHAFDDTTDFQSEQAALTSRSIAIPRIIVPDPEDTAVMYGPIDYNQDFEWEFCDLPGYYPIACEYCSLTDLVYVVDGNGNLIRINDLVAETWDQFDLNAAQAGAKACRLRYGALTEDIYLPSMTTDSVLLWDPITELYQVKTGFDSPIDVVFTNSKAFAVQNSPLEPLKEIV